MIDGLSFGASSDAFVAAILVLRTQSREINSIARERVPLVWDEGRCGRPTARALGFTLTIEHRRGSAIADGHTLVEVTRGLSVESRHTGSIAVADADGALVIEIGDVERPVFARSCVKAFQALPLIESGGADRYGFSDAELALACGSHGGEPDHVEAAAGALARLGLGASALECGAHWPLDKAAARALASSGQGPTALHNNCSGKHAGFLCVACALEVETSGYLAIDHPVQREVTAAVADVTRHELGSAPHGLDGCGAPTYALPLAAIARGFARFGTGAGLGRERADAARRLMRAVWSAPTMVAGARRFDTEAMRLLGESAFVKTGAEGVHAAAIPGLGLGVAIKIDDGATRAAEAAMAAMLLRLVRPEGEAAEPLRLRARRTLYGSTGEPVGEIRAIEALPG